ARLDVIALADTGDQFVKLRLRLALRSLEAVPALLAFAGFRRLVDDDGPMTGRPFADVASHLEPSLSVSLTGSFTGGFFSGGGILGSGVSLIGSSGGIT